MSTSWTDPRHDGQGTWQHTPAHTESITDVIVALVACALGALLMLALLVTGRHVMCSAHDQQLTYCPGYKAVQQR